MSATGMMQRCWEHDYCAPSFYMITVVTEPRRGCLSTLDGTAFDPLLRLSPIGEVVREVWQRTSGVYPGVEACECVVMPDHFHGILWVKERLVRPMGHIVKAFKRVSTQECRSKGLLPPEDPVPVPAAAPAAGCSTFRQEGFQDSILLRKGQLKAMVNYIADNPRRLLATRAHPELFTVVAEQRFGPEHACPVVGNRYLLQHPLKRQVQISRRITPEALAAQKAELLYVAEHGAVLVSPCISPGKKEIARAALEAQPIESHLGGLLYEKGTYYWYGMNFDKESIKPGTVRGQIFSWMENRGVTCYSSRDLYNWKFETVSLLPTRDDPKAPLQPTHSICRPKVIRCDKTGKYVMMGQLFSIDMAVNCIVVGIADTPSGPFAYHGLLNPPDGGRDITLFKDDDGKAYLIRGYGWVKADVLTDDYLSIASTHDLQGVKGEAPAIFKHEGTYYCLTSQLTGYAPNANKYSIAKQVLGPWEPKGEFCKGPEANKTFGGQTTFVLPVAGVPGAFIFLADRWNSKTEYITEHRDATHIWLPITVDAATKTIQVPWRDTWDLSVFKQK